MGELIDLNSTIPASRIDSAIATDIEYKADDQAHLDAVDPHLQYPTQARGDARYARFFDSFQEVLQPPFNLTANTWTPLGSTRQVGQSSIGTSWLINIYFQYGFDTAGSGTSGQPWYQYCGAGILGAILWQADALANEGVSIPFEAHNEADFTARIRFGTGQARKLEINPSRAINIVSPGFGRILGTRLQ